MISDEELIYLDNNATTQLDPAVVEEMAPYLAKFYGNPSSGYQFSEQVRKAIDRARERVAFLLGCQASEIVFTSCGTESNNAAINSALQIDSSRKHIVTTAVEHSAILRHCQALAKRGCADFRADGGAVRRVHMHPVHPRPAKPPAAPRRPPGDLA